MTTVLLVVSIFIDIGLGGAAWKHAKRVEEKVDKLDIRMIHLEGKQS